MIGIIFSPMKLKRIIEGREPYENASFYTDLAKENEIDLFFYTIRSIHPSNKKVKGYLYLHQENKYIPHLSSIPKANLVRTIVRKKGYDKLKRVEAQSQVVFVNLVRGRDKYKIYKYLECIKRVSSHIPNTAKLSCKNFLHFFKTYEQIVIKPISGALGEKIYVIEDNEKHFTIYYTSKGKEFRKTVDKKKGKLFLKKNFKHPAAYLIQQYIPFQTFQGEKFDIRTSVQKGKDDQWKVTGIVTRVAGRNGLVTNVAQGGRVVPFNEVNCTLEQEIRSKIYDLSLQLAKEIETLNPSSVDLGLDIAIDRQGHLWFIEANYCDQRYAYREAKDLDMWEASYRTPFEYAYAVYKKVVVGKCM
jgi:glutathione synthase/RimK-type ligase-like ATP-grasp enzyme